MVEPGGGCVCSSLQQILLDPTPTNDHLEQVGSQRGSTAPQMALTKTSRTLLFFFAGLNSGHGLRVMQIMALLRHQTKCWAVASFRPCSLQLFGVDRSPVKCGRLPHVGTFLCLSFSHPTAFMCDRKSKTAGVGSCRSV